LGVIQVRTGLRVRTEGEPAEGDRVVTKRKKKTGDDL